MNFLLSLTNNASMLKGLDEALLLAEQNIENSVIIVLPETKTVMAERYLLERSKAGAFSNIYICSYNRLLSKLGVCNENYLLSRETGIYIIKKLIQELEGNLVCYKKASSFLGFAESVYDTISQLKSSGVTPEEFSSVARTSKGALPTKMADIALLYDAYENYLGERYLDMSDSLNEIAKASVKSEFIKSSHIFVLGFETVTSQMDEAVLSFVKTAKSVTVSASYMHPTRKNAHISDNEVFNHYKKVADRLKIEYNPVIIHEKFSPDMKYIAENAFAYPLKATKSKRNIKFYVSQKIEDEVTFVAEEICRRVREGERFRDFGVMLADLENYEYDLKKIFDEYQIPYFLAKQYDLSKHLFFVMLKHILEISRIGYDPEHMIALSKCRLLKLEGSASEFENYIYRTGVKFSGFLNSFESQDSTHIKQDKMAEEMRQSVLNALGDVCESLSKATIVKEYIAALRNFFDKHDMMQRIEEFKKEQELLGEMELAAVTEQVYDKIQKSFAVLEEFLGESSVSPSEFSDLLLSGLSSVEISLIPLELDSVLVQTRTDGMNSQRKLFVLGASEGKFPVSQEDCGMIRDAEINSLSDIFKVKIEPTIKTLNRRERYKAFETVIGFEEVQVMYSKTNHALEELSPSSFITSIASLFDCYLVAGDTVLESVKTSNFGVNMESIFTPQNLEKSFAGIVGKAKGGAVVSNADLSAMYQVLSDGSRLDFETMLAPQVQEPILEETKVFFKSKRTSISQLEKYFSCPFMHFADYGLGLRDRPVAKMQAIDVGDVLHKVAEVFVKRFIKIGDVHEDDYKRIVDDVLLSNDIAVANNKMLTNILEKEAYRLMHAIYDQLEKSDFKPVVAEAWFGNGGKYSSINLFDDVVVEGKIDRVDSYNNFYKVIDYKTGKIEENPESVYYGKKVQLLSYIQAIQDTNPNLKPAGALYFPVRNEWAESKKKAAEAYKNKGYLLKDEEVLTHMDTDLLSSNTSTKLPVRFVKAKNGGNSDARDFGAEGNLLTANEFVDITDYIKNLEAMAVREVMMGYITPSPLVMGNKNPCAYCDYKCVCGLDKQTHKEGRKALTNIKFSSFLKGEK